MPFLIPVLMLVGVGAYILLKGSQDTSVLNTFVSQTPNELVVPTNMMNLPDVVPMEQQGGFDTSFDDAFEAASIKWHVPFSMLKAHGLRESLLKPGALRNEPSGKASFGIMQVLWWPSSNRFNNYGYSDDMIGDGSLLYDPGVNIDIAAQLIADNWRSLGNVRDIINAYNTGVRESKRVAPNNYVNDVLDYYSKIIGRPVL